MQLPLVDNNFWHFRMDVSQVTKGTMTCVD